MIGAALPLNVVSDQRQGSSGILIAVRMQQLSAAADYEMGNLYGFRWIPPRRIRVMFDEENRFLRREAEHFFTDCVAAIFQHLGFPPKEWGYDLRWDREKDTNEEGHGAYVLKVDIYGGPVSLPINTVATLFYTLEDLYFQVGQISFHLPDGRTWPYLCSRFEGKLVVSSSDPYKSFDAA